MGATPMTCVTQRRWCEGTVVKAVSRDGISSGYRTGGRVIDASRIASFLVCLLVFSGAFSASARAKNLDILVRYLVPVFLAQNFAAVCQANDPKLLSEMTGKGTDANAFSQHVKMEITRGLTPAETQFVLVSAANTARHAARTAFRKFSPNYPQMPTEPLRKWCREEAQTYISLVMDKHFEEHANFLAIIGRAKSDASSAPD